MDDRDFPSGRPGLMMVTSLRDPQPKTRFSVLVVDDDAALGNAYRRLLARMFEVTLTESGEEALALLASGHDYDVLLLDLSMPRMDGTELYRRIVGPTPGSTSASSSSPAARRPCTPSAS